MKRIILFLVFFLMPAFVFSQECWYSPVPKNFMSLGNGKQADILVVGDPGSHTQRVITTIKNVDASLKISVYPYRNVSILNPFYYADSVGIGAIVIPASNAIMMGDFLERLYEKRLLQKDIMLFAPMPSNDHVYCKFPSQINEKVIGVSSSDAEGNRALRAYGPALEFVDYVPDANYNSFVVAKVAAKFVVLKKKMQIANKDEVISWADVRQRAREIASNKGIWREENGYGIIRAVAINSYPSLTPTRVEEERGAKKKRISLQNYPNPFNSATTIKFSLTKTAFVILSIYNVRGQRVTVLAKGDLFAGQHTIRWRANSFPSGQYFLVLQAGDRKVVRRILLIK